MSKQGENYSFIDSVLRRIKRWRTKKSLATALGVLVLAVAMWGMSADISYAQTTRTLGTGLVLDMALAYGIFYFGAVLLGQILSWGLGIVASFLDFAFFLNSYINPGQLAIVQEGWRNLRDLANGIFILLLLWIAITIVFNLDGLGGKKLLVRVIIVALLINFSLVMVSTIFAFGNELAKPFAKAMGANICNEQKSTNGKVTITCTKSPVMISSLIMQNSHLQETTQVFTNEGVLESFTQAREEFNKPIPIQSQSRYKSLSQYLGAPQVANASIASITTGTGLCAAGALLVGAPTAGLGAVAVLGACALLSNYAIPVATGFLLHALGTDVWLMKLILNQLVASLFLFLTLTAMLTAAVILFLRLVAMVFLGVSAPIAFLGFAFPKFGERFWSVWLNNLFRWTAVTPIFYFLLYLALLMLQTNNINITATPSGGVPLMGNIYRIMNLVLFLVFLWAAVYITKKTAGHFADVALSLGRKGLGFGLGVATGFMARGATSMTRRGAPAIEKVLGGAARIGALKPLRTRFRTIMADQRKQVDTESSRLKGLGLTPDQLVQEHNGSMSAATKVAAGQLLAEKGKYDLLGERGQRTLDLAAQYGADPVMNIFKTNPGLATPTLLKRIDPTNTAATPADAWGEVLKKVNPSDAEKMSDKAFDDAALVAAMWKQFEPEHIKRIARSDRPHLIQKMVGQLNTNPAIAPSINERMRQYLSSTAARELGLTIPLVSSGSTPVITPGVIPMWTAGVENTFTPRMTGGTGTITWRFGAGFVPPAWLTIHAGTGTITADATAPSGVTLSVPIEAEDGTGTVSTPQTFLIRIS